MAVVCCCRWQLFLAVDGNCLLLLMDVMVDCGCGWQLFVTVDGRCL